MKISLSFNKKKKKEEENETKEAKKEQKNKNNFQDNKKGINERDKIKNVFHSSSDEEVFDFENNHNKKIAEKKKKEIENEIKEYIYEHENVPVQENKNEKDKKNIEKPKKEIQYLGYKGEELTKFHSDKLKEDVKKNYHSISSKDEYNKSITSKETDNDIKKKRYGPNFKKMNTGSYKDYNREKNYDKIKNKKNDDDLNIDEIFTKKENNDNNNNNNKSKYMDALINSSKRRMMEKEILMQKKLKIDTEKDKVFVTNAYKKKMAERQLIKQDIEEENENVESSNQTSLNFNLFLKNINAPSNYNRNNRLYNENQNLEDF
ncbi:hypothetical protein YYC_02016 [Plasmodium yoelii 17X]|uniref:Nuclear speckle splicing regulatory protein 1 N-terminal domain-containing protein n=1 Tax=Plasmodium yoelii 17X TaxID=1323249 RepID=V7PQU4_PLAYE|nr:hypothetical protein YYC_02016 [Plasmodium yoelii 17X]